MRPILNPETGYTFVFPGRGHFPKALPIPTNYRPRLVFSNVRQLSCISVAFGPRTRCQVVLRAVSLLTGCQPRDLGQTVDDWQMLRARLFAITTFDTTFCN